MSDVTVISKKAITLKFLIGASAYCTIEKDGRKLDVLLSAGKSPKSSLIETAKEMQDKAARLLATAELIADAADTL